VRPKDVRTFSLNGRGEFVILGMVKYLTDRFCVSSILLPLRAGVGAKFLLSLFLTVDSFAVKTYGLISSRGAESPK
jgi:hypothetical protein